MAIININRWQNKVRAVFGIKGGNPIPEIRDLTPVAMIESEKFESLFPGGDLAWATVMELPAVAAETGTIILFNPSTSGVLLVVEKFSESGITFLNGWAFTRFEPVSGAGGFDTVSPLWPRDGRAWQLPGFSSPVGPRLIGGTLTVAERAAVVFSSLMFSSAFAGTGRGEPHIVIPPGMGFGYHNEVAAQASSIAIWGRQHILEAGLLS